MKTLGRHRFRDSYIGPVGDLRTTRTHILIRDLIARKGMNINEKNLRKALKKVDLEWKGTTRADYKREMKTAQEISRLYNVIVQTPSDEPIPWRIIGKVRRTIQRFQKPPSRPENTWPTKTQWFSTNLLIIKRTGPGNGDNQNVLFEIPITNSQPQGSSHI